MESSGFSLRRICLLSALASLPLLLAGCGTSLTPASVTTGSSANHSAPLVASGPTLGFVWNAADSTLRPLTGVPGSAVMGASIVPAGKYSAGAASVRLQLALLADPSGRIWVQPLGGNGTAQQVANGAPQGVRFNFAPTADSAVAYAPGAGSLFMLTGLSTTPAVESVSVPAGLLSATISDNEALLIAASTASGASLQTRGSGSAFGTPIAVGKFGGMTFVSGGSDAVYADAQNNTVFILHSNTGLSSPVAAAKDGVKTPAAVGASIDQRWVGVVNSADGSLLRVDLSGAQAAQRLTCACTPSQLSPLSGNGVFLMTDGRTAAPVWALDVASTTPRTFFVPALQGTAGAR